MSSLFFRARSYWFILAAIALTGCGGKSSDNPGEGQYTYVSQYPWAVFDSVVLPALLTESESSGAGLVTDQNECLRAAFIEEEKKNFRVNFAAVYERPATTSCDEGELELGTTYGHRVNGNLLEVYRFVDMPAGLFKVQCNASDLATTDVNQYVFQDDNRFKTVQWSSLATTGQSKVRSFSKFVDDANYVEAKFVQNLGDTQKEASIGRYGAAGDGSVTNYLLISGTSAETFRLYFTTKHGYLTESYDADDGEGWNPISRSYVNPDFYTTSRAFMEEAALDFLDQLRQDSTPDPRVSSEPFEFAELPEGLICSDDITFIDCEPLSPEAANPGSGASQSTASCNSTYDAPRNWFEDADGVQDSRLQAQLSGPKASGSGVLPIGKVAGLRAFFGESAVSAEDFAEYFTVEVSDQLELLTLECTETDGAMPATGIADDDSEACAIKESFPVLIKAKATASNGQTETVEILGRGGMKTIMEIVIGNI